jgi:streptogrisin C
VAAKCLSIRRIQASTGKKGTSTAGHCPDNLTWRSYTLPWQGGTTGGVNDIQWNLANSPVTPRNQVYDGGGLRSITSVKYRAYQLINEWVCKYGVTTTYGCGQIVTTSFDGVNVQVHNVNVQGGDSGGPWFYGNTAYGTTISKYGSDAIYGPIDDYLNVLGVVVLTY